MVFIHGNISRCNGCKGHIKRGEDGKPLPAPGDLVLRHPEYVVYQNPKTGLFRQSCDKRNVYYHPQRTCVAPNFLNFVPEQHIHVDLATIDKLSREHKELLSVSLDLTSKQCFLFVVSFYVLHNPRLISSFLVFRVDYSCELELSRA